MKQEHISAKDFREGNYNKPKAPKYRNKLTFGDGRLFDSQKEANYYQELKLMKQTGEIIDFLCQVPLMIVPGRYENEGTPRQKWIRPVFYVTDYFVIVRAGVLGEIGFKAPVRIQIHEVKGMWTDKAKLAFKRAQELYPQYEFKVI